MKTIVQWFIAIVFLVGCAERDKHGKILDSPTAGTIKITADEALKPLIDAEIQAFEGIYQNAKLQVKYLSEADAIDALLNDSARLTVVTRRLVEDEENMLVEQTIIPHQLKIATSGIALITNRQNADTLISIDEVKKIFQGKINVFSSKDPLSVVVFDNPTSGIVRFLKDSLSIGDGLPEYCFAVNSNASVVEYVSKTPHALGLIDVSWISDRDDSTANSFLSSVRVLGISRDSGYFQPFQAYIAQGSYPLVRDIVMISREARSGLASGFMAFVASDKGQRIVLKSGLVPATMPIRIVEINHEPF